VEVIGRGGRRARIVACAATIVIAAAIATEACDDAPFGAPVADAGTDAPLSPMEGGADAVADAAPTRAPFGLDVRPSNGTCKAPARPAAAGPVEMRRVFTNVVFPTPPTALVQAPGDRTRWFVALRDGRIVSFPTASPPVTPPTVADVALLSGMPVSVDGEGGLLGLAFHPKFAQNGQLFVSWTTTGGPAGLRSVVSRLTSLDGGTTFTQHATVLGPFDQPDAVHKGGDLAFGPDGYLYLSFGDGGDPTTAQKKTGFLGKILRIDVDAPAGGKAFGIPPSNPFASDPAAEPSTFARGLRNPFRFSIDRASGDVWVGDVGENDREEIDLVKAGGNYGWPCREGAADYLPASCSSGDSLIDPVYDYVRTAVGAAVTGGVVYRGAAMPAFAGTYVFGDSFLQQIYALSFDPTTGAPVRTTIDGPAAYWVDFAEDADGEIYATNLDSSIYELVPKGAPPPSTFPDRLSKTGCVDEADPKRPAAALVPYTVRSPLWSDGADKDRWFAIPDGKTVSIGADGDFDVPIGSVLVKTFSLAGRRIETRLFVRHDDGDWAGYSYAWDDAQSDAVLLPARSSKKVGAQTWTFPSRSDCVSCHSSAAGRTLGLELGQLNGDFVYTSTNRIANQLQTLEHIGIFAAPLGRPLSSIVAYADPAGTDPAETRARSYLHANCSSCHRPTGPGRGSMDLRFATTLAATKTCGVAPLFGDLGIANASIVAPGSPASSILSLRAHARGASRMPPVGSSVVDPIGSAAIDAWIAALGTCL